MTNIVYFPFFVKTVGVKNIIIEISKVCLRISYFLTLSLSFVVRMSLTFVSEVSCLCSFNFELSIWQCLTWREYFFETLEAVLNFSTS